MATNKELEETTQGEDGDRQTKIIIIKNLKTVSLDRNNYFAWRIRFAAYLAWNELDHYLSGKAALNSPVAIRQDKLILA